MEELPVIDVSPLRRGGGGDVREVAARIDAACRDTGFFFVVGHDIPADLRQRLDLEARQFFALPDEEKAQIAMANGGRAWRGWFPIGGELTSGVPDQKEGIYFGQELGARGPSRARRPAAARAEPVPRATARAPARRCWTTSTR